MIRCQFSARTLIAPSRENWEGRGKRNNAARQKRVLPREEDGGALVRCSEKFMLRMRDQGYMVRVYGAARTNRPRRVPWTWNRARLDPDRFQISHNPDPAPAPHRTIHSSQDPLALRRTLSSNSPCPDAWRDALWHVEMELFLPWRGKKMCDLKGGQAELQRGNCLATIPSLHLWSVGPSQLSRLPFSPAQLTHLFCSQFDPQFILVRK
jgi:hypothetical protein